MEEEMQEEMKQELCTNLSRENIQMVNSRCIETPCRYIIREIHMKILHIY